MLQNFYEISIENTSSKWLKAYRVLECINILLKLLSVCIISLTTIFSPYYWFLVVGVFLLSSLISVFAGNVLKYYKYTYKAGTLEVRRVGFNKREKLIFSDKVSNYHFTKKYVENTIEAHSGNFTAIITNNEKYLLFSPDRYMIGLIENDMKVNK